MIVLLTLEGPDDAATVRALRELLKRLRRSHRVRCTSVRTLDDNPAGSPATTAPTGQR